MLYMTIFPGTDIYKKNTDNVTFLKTKDKERHHLSEHFLPRSFYLFFFYTILYERICLQQKRLNMICRRALRGGIEILVLYARIF